MYNQRWRAKQVDADPELKAQRKEAAKASQKKWFSGGKTDAAKTAAAKVKKARTLISKEFKSDKLSLKAFKQLK